MRVAHVITGLRTGGAEIQLQLLLRHTTTDPMVVALSNADEVADAIRTDGIPVVNLEMRSNRDLKTIGALTTLLQRHRPDVVHLHLYRATVYGRVAARLAGVPVVVTTEHSLLDGQIEGRPVTRAVRGLYLATEPLNSATVAVSDEVARRLVDWGVPAPKVHTIPNGIELARFTCRDAAQRAKDRARMRAALAIPDHAQVVGGIGRLYPSKRWDLLLRALACDLGEHRRLLLVGAGEEEAQLRRLAASLSITEWVHMPGATPEMAPMLAAMDVVASPAPQETFGMAGVEAAAAGLPVVYVHSPALEVLGSVPGLTRASGAEQPLRDAILTALSSRDRPPEAALARYDIRINAQAVDSLYGHYRHRKHRP